VNDSDNNGLSPGLPAELVDEIIERVAQRVLKRLRAEHVPTANVHVRRAGMGREKQFDSDQRERALELLESLPWEDLDGARRTIEETLRLAMEATRNSFRRWEDEAEATGYVDEFSVSPSEADELSDRCRLAYVARLLRTLALSYGVCTEFGGKQFIGQEAPNSVAALVRGLNDISLIRLTTGDEPA
jgi:hypothetical protein